MSVGLENLIDLSLLTYYDENIKQWILDRISKATQDIIFTTKNELPVEGKKGILYVTEEAIFIWNGAKYIDITSSQSGGNTGVWGTF